MNKFVAKMIMPFVKGFIVKQIKDEEFQKEFVKGLLEKVDLPNLTKAQEKKFVNQVYDATQELLINYVEAM